MTTYIFETMTAQEAASFTSADRLIFSNGSILPSDISVVNLGNVNITTITANGKSLSFEGSQLRSARIDFISSFIVADSSTFYPGDSGNDNLIIAGGENNVAYGFGGDDRLTGNVNADRLHGGGGNDTIEGGIGNDTLTPGDGNDVMTGGIGNDVFVVAGSGTKTITDFTHGIDRLDLTGTGIQNLESLRPYLSSVDGNVSISGVANGVTLNYTLQDTILDDLVGSNDIVYSTSSPESSSGTDNGSGTEGGRTVNGTEGSNSLSGGAGNDTINGFGGNDILNGFGGNDRLVGGLGDDVYIVDASGDIVVENGDAGRDAVWTYLTSLNLADYPNVEDAVVLQNSGAAVTGTDGANSLKGRDGSDTIDGLNGNDTLTGGAGSDLFVVRGTGSKLIVDFIIGQDKIDLSLAGFGSFSSLTPYLSAVAGAAVIGGLVNGVTTSYTLQGIAPAQLSASDFIFSSGSSSPSGWVSTGGDTLGASNGSDSLVGGPGSDTINALAGNDTLNGGAGNDRLVGGSGDDIYIVDATGDVIIENANEGNDSIRTNLASYSLANLPNVENLASTGSGGALLTGNSAANVLTGGSGTDTLNGGGGDDVLVQVGSLAGHEQFKGGAGLDTLRVSGTLLSNTAYGTAYVVDLSGGQLDSIERIQFASTGSNKTQIIVSFEQLNSLGALPTVLGGPGTDQLVVRAGAAGTYQLPAISHPGWTTILDSGAPSSDVDILEGTQAANYTLKAGTDHGTLQWLVGNSGNDVLIGNGGFEILAGNGGNDTITGGGGRDVMKGGAGSDIFVLDGIGQTVIDDFTPGQDKIDLSHLDVQNFTALEPAFFEILDGTRFNVGDLHVILNNLDASTLSSSSFIFAEDIPPATLRGTSGADTLEGTAGADSLSGAAGNDTLRGLGGNDTLDGGSGSDRMEGGTGDDIYVVDAAGDVVIEQAGAGSDLIRTSLASLSLGSQANIENIVFTGAGATKLTGNAAANSLTGGAGADSLAGADGDDVLNGGAGNDMLDGGGGVDSLFGGDGNDVLILAGPSTGQERYDGGSGTDALRLSSTVNIAGPVGSIPGVDLTAVDLASIERLEFSSTTNRSLGVVIGMDQLGGGLSASATLTGGAGSDLLILVAGEAGFYQLPVFNLNGWSSSDVTILQGGSAVDYTLRAATTHGDMQMLSGNAGNDRLLGGNGIEKLLGNAGNDTLAGGDGNDTLTGGAGNDVFMIEGSGSKVVTDFVSGQDRLDLSAAGFDSLASVQPYLSSSSGNVLLKLGATSVTLQGVTLSSLNSDSFIFDTTGAPRTLSGTSAADFLNGAGGGDNISGGGGNDTLNGFGGADTLDGGVGGDRLVGGAGNDFYVVDSTADVILEEATSGVDTVRTSLTAFSLASLANVENLVFTGTAAAKLTGNGANNLLSGGSAKDSLNGGGGDDVLAGGSGSDTLTGGAGSDIFRFDAAPDASSNVDRITDFNAADDSIALDSARFTSLAPGSIGADMFRSGGGVSSAADGNDFLIYNRSSGALYYDADGAGGAARAVQIAIFTGSPVLTYEDFVIF